MSYKKFINIKLCLLDVGDHDVKILIIHDTRVRQKMV